MAITTRTAKSGKTVFDIAFMYHGVRYKKRGFASRAAAEAWEIEVKHEVNTTGSHHSPSKKTINQLWHDYMTIEKARYRVGTIKRYEAVWAKIAKHPIAKRRITELGYADIQKFFHDLGQLHRQSTSLIAKNIFNLIFKFAIRNEYIKHNPTPYVQLKGSKREPSSKKTISYDEFTALYRTLRGGDFEEQAAAVGIAIGYYTGARIGEVMALEKSDIDLLTHRVNFHCRIEYHDQGKPYKADMKTAASHAIVPLVAPLEAILREWYAINPYETVCCKKDGSLLTYYDLGQKSHTTAKRLGFDFHFHMLRHTYASRIINAGVNVATARDLLRHSDVATTLGIYSHADLTNEKSRLDSIFNQELPQNYPKVKKAGVSIRLKS